MPTVLLIEDDHVVRAALVRALVDLDYAVFPVGTAAEALREVANSRYDLVILDLGLPDLDGSTALRMIRSVSEVPIIVATARQEETTVVRLLNSGADDFIVKPFSSEHLAARMLALLRRTTPPRTRANRFIVGQLTIDLAERSAELGGQLLELTRLEFDLLAYLAEHEGRVISRRALIENVWQTSGKINNQTIDVHLSWLRRKLGETAAEPRYLHTVRGVGLKLVAPK